MDDRVDSFRKKALALRGQGRATEAVEAYRQLLAEQPELTDDWYELGLLLKAAGRHEEALEAYAEALARGVQHPEEVHLNRAVIYADCLRRDAAAERELKAALAIRPEYLPALLNLGNLHEERGRREDAAACYKQVLESRKAGGEEEALRCEALARLVQLHPPERLDDPLLARLRAEAADSEALDDATRANLGFSLGRAYDGIGAYDEAFAAFAEANRCARRSGPAYDAARAEQVTQVLVDAFAGPAPDVAQAQAREAGPEPVFICGMFRSGSTLLEQALAGHPDVTAGGELDILPRLIAGTLRPFPTSIASLDENRAAILASEYCNQLAMLFPQAARRGALVTDKRPDNFRLIGLIKRLFPDARILHTVRNPLDNCLSVFFQHLDQRLMPAASDLENIAHYFGQYRRLMAHWKTLYRESIQDFDYDAFVRDPRPALEAALAFLGLGWDDSCLDFQDRDGTVKTASYWQVRRPLYREASGRWRHYSTHLGPLREALIQAGVEDVEAD
jgi:tetratricopeptide (TPR) repeat protein